MRQVWINAICAVLGLLALTSYLFGNHAPLWMVEIVGVSTGGLIACAITDYRDVLRKKLGVLKDSL